MGLGKLVLRATLGGYFFGHGMHGEELFGTSAADDALSRSAEHAGAKS